MGMGGYGPRRKRYGPKTVKMVKKSPCAACWDVLGRPEIYDTYSTYFWCGTPAGIGHHMICFALEGLRLSQGIYLGLDFRALVRFKLGYFTAQCQG